MVNANFRWCDLSEAELEEDLADPILTEGTDEISESQDWPLDLLTLSNHNVSSHSDIGTRSTCCSKLRASKDVLRQSVEKLTKMYYLELMRYCEAAHFLLGNFRRKSTNLSNDRVSEERIKALEIGLSKYLGNYNQRLLALGSSSESESSNSTNSARFEILNFAPSIRENNNYGETYADWFREKCQNRVFRVCVGDSVKQSDSQNTILPSENQCRKDYVRDNIRINGELIAGCDVSYEDIVDSLLSSSSSTATTSSSENDDVTMSEEISQNTNVIKSLLSRDFLPRLTRTHSGSLGFTHLIKYFQTNPKLDEAEVFLTPDTSQQPKPLEGLCIGPGKNYNKIVLGSAQINYNIQSVRDAGSCVGKVEVVYVCSGEVKKKAISNTDGHLSESESSYRLDICEMIFFHCKGA